MIADGKITDYLYDKVNHLLQAGDDSFTYDNNGNLIEKTTKDGTVNYEYSTDNRLLGVYYPDETKVEFIYDAFRRKISREETFYDLKDFENKGNGKGNEKSNSNSNGNSNGNANSNDNGKGSGKTSGINGKANAINRGDGEKTGLIRQMENPYADLLKTETTNFLYDGMNVLNEYGEKGEPLAQYYTANGQVLAKQMFGFHGRKQEGYEGNIRTRGGLMYYQQDALGNVMDVTDHIGDTVMKYRYDAFGNLFTQMAAPYNTVGFTGKSYDAKASLMDYSARWYSPNYGRFITEDTFFGWMDEPLSLNKYSYVHNNPIKYTDPTGNVVEVPDPGGGGSTGSVSLYIDGEENGNVSLSDGKTYLSDGSGVRDYYESMGYTVTWKNNAVYVYKNDSPSNGGGGGSSGSSNNDSSPGLSIKDQITNKEADFGNQAGEIPVTTGAQQTSERKTSEKVEDFFQLLDNFGTATMMYDPIPNNSLPPPWTPVTYIDNGGGFVLKTIGKVGKVVTTKVDEVVNATKGAGKTTLDYLKDIKNINGKYYAPKNTIDEIGKIEANGIDFSNYNKHLMNSRPSTEGGLSRVIKYSDEKGTKFIIHEVTDDVGNILHRDFDAVRIESGQIINKLGQ